ncbi:tryptophan halogenase family protein [Alteromonas sp. KUL49]|uniref:tryptophan halogenase family protein n=1 Tax=Alteromonas sp. KUL49 TaxID=2480798 RepID=UPI00102F016C|nr:tryptophan halogenase family protein [Alteromonas sp. KUL49]TAP39245.1 tryptophan 7-halogenase [Alteromonas sp. KUL49]
MNQTSQNSSKQKIVIVGGGTAGWLSAAIIAAKHKVADGECGLDITLVESSDIPTVGVGEGTWPTMRNTLKDIGLSEKEVFKRCSAAFKQGGKFVNWVAGNNDYYYHPFTVPLGYGRVEMAPYVDNIAEFANATNFQQHVCEHNMAPRTLSEEEYSSAQSNYAYHLDAGAFADQLREFSKSTLGVKHTVATVLSVQSNGTNNIESITLDNGECLSADLFIDCSGFKSLLLGETLQEPLVSTDDVLFNNSALALHVPYEGDYEIKPYTQATAQEAGWIWDIGLASRRGVGHVYSTNFISDDKAETLLRNYVGDQAGELSARVIRFNSGYRKNIWKGNVVGIGLAAGFVEPLEATALMLIEISARFVAEQMPLPNAAMPIVSQRFNKQMQYRWQRIIDFLKLHYIFNQRSEDYWVANRNPATIPDSLKEDLEIWKYRGPQIADFSAAIELFPAASYQYVLYGMGFSPDFSLQSHFYNERDLATKVIQQNQLITQQKLSSLPNHRDYIAQWLAS